MIVFDMVDAFTTTNNALLVFGPRMYFANLHAPSQMA